MEKAWLTITEIAEAVQGDYSSGGPPIYVGSANAREIAQRVAQASSAKAKRLRETSEKTVVREIVFTEEPLTITETLEFPPYPNTRTP